MTTTAPAEDSLAVEIDAESLPTASQDELLDDSADDSSANDDTSDDDSADTTPSFADLGIPQGLSDFLGEQGFTSPFEVQTVTLPDALAGRDIAARAPTGSGKTLAFGLPLLMRVENARPRHPRGLVLAPTRELADQIQRELQPIARAGGRSVIAVYGGVGYEPQRRALRRGVDVLVACPGRLADLIEQGDLDLDEVEVVVIDEADRMSDMGFLPEVKRLLDRTPNDRQTLLFSATLDGDVGVLTRRYQNNPARHEVGDAEPNVEDMRHIFWRLDSDARVDVASDLIQAVGPTIVFVRTRRGADRIQKQLEKVGARSVAIHGSRSQAQRTRALKAFADGKVEALVATDVAARGIHVDGVECVLHFDPPIDDKTYLHRSGRTARAGAQGIVVSFVSHDQVRDTDRMVRNLRLRVDLNTPAPKSLQDAKSRLEADPDESFADESLAMAGFSRGGSGGGNRGGGNRGGNGGQAGGQASGRRRGAPRPADRPGGPGGPGERRSKTRSRPRGAVGDGKTAEGMPASRRRPEFEDGGSAGRDRRDDRPRSGSSNVSGGNRNANGGRSRSERPRADRPRTDRPGSDRPRNDRPSNGARDGAPRGGGPRGRKSGSNPSNRTPAGAGRSKKN